MRKSKRFYLFLFVLFIIIPSSFGAKRPKNVVFLIGDGMGIAQIYAGMVANNNTLALEQCTFSGFSKTYSSSSFTTDSGAGGTALACGVKTRNGMIGMSPDSVGVESILEKASRNKLSTGIVVTSSVTHATPATFIAHQINRNMDEDIADDYLKSNIDVFIGGGKKYFDDRIDGKNLLDELKSKGYIVATSIEEVKSVKSGKVAGLLYDDQNPPMPERGTMLPDATAAALDILDNNKKGFFLMIEGSQIDWAAHDNNTEQVVKEMLDFDNTIRCVLNFAIKNKNTLVIITADHETGGMTIPKGRFGSDKMEGLFTTKNHTGVPVPFFSYGPGADNFSGFMENTAFKNKISKLLKLK